jgi:hypothetical protein
MVMKWIAKRWIMVGFACVLALGFMVPSVSAENDLFKATVTGATLNKAGDVVVHVAVTCTAPAIIYYADATLVQRAGGSINAAVGSGRLSEYISDCAPDNLASFSIPIGVDGGVFHPGRVEAAIFLAVCLPGENGACEVEYFPPQRTHIKRA